MTVAFFGLTGPTGVLPHCLYRDDDGSEPARGRPHGGGVPRPVQSSPDLAVLPGLGAHTARTWPTRPGERGSDLPAGIFDLVGLGLEPLQNRSAVLPRRGPPLSTLGSFARRGSPCGGPRPNLLNDYFGLPHRGRPVRRPVAPPGRVEDRSRLGGVGRSQRPGHVTLVVGARVLGRAGEVPPAGRAADSLATASWPSPPMATDFRALAQLHPRPIVDSEFAFDVQLILAASEVPACRLGPSLPRFAPVGPFRLAQEPPVREGCRGRGVRLGRLRRLSSARSINR